MTSPLAALPPGSRVWVFAADRDLTAVDKAHLDDLMTRVYQVWQKKAEGVLGVHEFRDDRFLVVGSDERCAQISGCGIDAMVSWMKHLEEDGLRLVDRMLVHWRGADGHVRSALRPDFRRLLAAGEVGPATLVFDTAISKSDQLPRFELPLSESWHAQVFLGAPATSR